MTRHTTNLLYAQRYYERIDEAIKTLRFCAADYQIFVAEKATPTEIMNAENATKQLISAVHSLLAQENQK